MKRKILLTAAFVLASLGATAAPLTVPDTIVTDLTTTATNIGGSAFTVWGGIALAVMGLVIFKKLFGR